MEKFKIKRVLRHKKLDGGVKKTEARLWGGGSMHWPGDKDVGEGDYVKVEVDE
jgi:hypothetical protein